MTEEQGYRVPEVCRVVGISYRQLDYWARTGLVSPSIKEAGGSGTQRLYSFRNIVELRAIKQLLDAGVSLQRIRKAVDFLREHLRKPPHGVTLMAVGNGIYLVESPDEVVDLLRRGQGVFGIDLEKVWTDAEGAVKKVARPAARAGGA